MSCTLQEIKDMLPPTVCQASDDELIKIFNNRLMPQMWSTIAAKMPNEIQKMETITVSNPTTNYPLPADFGSLISINNQDCSPLQQSSAIACCASAAKNWYYLRGNEIVVSDEADFTEIKLAYQIKRPKVTSMTDELPFPEWLCNELGPALSGGMAYYYFKNNGYNDYVEEWEMEFASQLEEIQDPVIISPCGGTSYEDGCFTGSGYYYHNGGGC